MKKLAKLLIRLALQLDPTLPQITHSSHSYRRWVISLDELFADDRVAKRNKLRAGMLKPLVSTDTNQHPE